MYVCRQVWKSELTALGSRFLPTMGSRIELESSGVHSKRPAAEPLASSSLTIDTLLTQPVLTNLLQLIMRPYYSLEKSIAFRRRFTSA